MQRPEPRSTNNDMPRHPSTFSSAGMTTSRTCAIPASMDDGCASIVVERAYTRPTPPRSEAAPRGRHRAHRCARSPPKPRSDQLGCPEMGESELELAVVELVGARLGSLRVLEGR